MKEIKEIKTEVYYKEKYRKVTIKLFPFPKKSLIEGVKRNNKSLRRTNKENLEFHKTYGHPDPNHKPYQFELDKLEDFKDMKLANYKERWWLFYAEKHMTGSFDSRRKAIEWFEHAGR